MKSLSIANAIKSRILKKKKRDTSREGLTKKMPHSKGTNELSQGDKVLDLILNTMSTFMDKLSTMEAQISGLTSRMDSTTGVTPVCKSRSREKCKRVESADISDDHTTLFSTGPPICSGEGMAMFTQTFLDTVVTFKPTPTPARAKKPKPDADLGVTPLDTFVQKMLDHQFANVSSNLPRVTATATGDWDFTVQGPNTSTGMGNRVKVGCDDNQNFQYHTDQYGNSVQVQAIIGQKVHEPMFFQVMQEKTQTQTMDLLKASPMIQRLVEERVAILEACMKS